MQISSVGIQTIVSNTVLSNIGTGNDVLKHIPMVSGDKGSFDVLGRGKAIIYISRKRIFRMLLRHTNWPLSAYVIQSQRVNEYNFYIFATQQRS